MHCCSFLGFSSRWLPAVCLALGGLIGAPALAQTSPVPLSLGVARNFPDAALRGKLVVTASGQAEINGKAFQMAPGMRLFSPQNTLVMLHTVLGQSFTVNYLMEHSTGMLITAWILSSGEAAQPHTAPGRT